MAEQQLQSYRASKPRKRIIRNSTGVQAIDLNSHYEWDLDKIGLCTGVILKITGTVTIDNTGTGVIANLGPWSLIKRLKLTTASGASLYDTPGYDAFQLNKRQKVAWGPDGAGLYTEATDVYSVPVVQNTANAWELHLWVPFSQNDGSMFDSGIFGLQSNVTQVKLELDTATAGTDFVSRYASEALTAEIWNVIYDPPMAGAPVRWPNNRIVKTISTQYSGIVAGENLLEIPRQGILLDAQLRCVFNGSRSNALDFIKFRTNYTDYYEDRKPSIDHFLYSRLYGKPADTGIFTLDFNSAGDLPFTGDMLHTYNLLDYSKTELVAQVTAGTTVSGTTYMQLTTRHWLPAQTIR